MKDEWINFCELFSISYDNFYRTSSPEHYENVQKIWNICLNNGDLYKKKYKGKYCLGCESFKLDKELENGRCAEHTSLELNEVEEENWFFKLSNYSDGLLKYFSDNNFLTPKFKRLELENLVKNSEDISVSRLKSKSPWGISVPNDDNHTIYVWFDALCNYILSIGWGCDNSNFNSIWNEQTIQICGPDNIRFQGIIWQSILASINIDYTNNLIVHGTILDNTGSKMSKTTGNVISPIEEFEKYGVDAIRFYILAGLSTHQNSKWSEDDLKVNYNDLANDYGNLITRTLHLIDINSTELNESLIDSTKKIEIQDLKIKSDNQFNEFNIKQACQYIGEIVTLGNRYINDTEPWKLEKLEREQVLNTLHYLLGIVADLYEPIIPDKIKEVKNSLVLNKKIIIFEKLD